MDDDVETLCRQILTYLGENPEASDTAQGPMSRRVSATQFSTDCNRASMRASLCCKSTRIGSVMEVHAPG